MKTHFTIVLAFLSSLSLAQPGALDPTFGSSGSVVLPIGTARDHAVEVIVQPDDKIVLVGYTAVTTDHDALVVRMMSDGSLDAGFGNNGIVTLAAGTEDDRGLDIAIQADGKLVLSGRHTVGGVNRFFVARLNADGSMDTGFGAGGYVTSTPGSINDRPHAIAVQNDGKILAGGTVATVSDLDFAMQRYLTDGTLDPSFGVGGVVAQPIGNGFDDAHALRIQADGKILQAGSSISGLYYDQAVARYETDGSLDMTFGSGGSAIIPIGFNVDYAFDVRLQNDGKPLLAGATWNGTDFDMAISRTTSDGQTDVSYGSGGTVTADLGADETIYGSALQSDGKLLVCGGSVDGMDETAFLARFEDTGLLDSDFGTAGVLTYTTGSGVHRIRSVEMQSNGRIIAIGQTDNGSDADLLVLGVQSGLSSSIGESTAVTPSFSITPMPITDLAQLNISLPQAGKVLIELLDATGRTFDTPVNRDFGAGDHSIDLSINSELPSGQYFMRLKINDRSVQRPLVKL